MREEVLAICVGNAYRSDDGVGLLVATLLEAGHQEGLRVRRESGDGAALLDAWTGAEEVILIDAARAGRQPGTIHRLEVFADSVPSEGTGSLVPAALFPYSTHAFGVAEAIDMARALGNLPAKLTIYAIEGAEFGSGTTISPEVEAAAQQVARSVLEYRQT